MKAARLGISIDLIKTAADDERILKELKLRALIEMAPRKFIQPRGKLTSLLVVSVC